MGLLDNLENEAIGKVMGSTSNPMASGLLQMIQNQPGGLAGLLQGFHGKGLGAVASSWVGTGRTCRSRPTRFIRCWGASRYKHWPRRWEFLPIRLVRRSHSCYPVSWTSSRRTERFLRTTMLWRWWAAFFRTLEKRHNLTRSACGWLPGNKRTAILENSGTRGLKNFRVPDFLNSTRFSRTSRRYCNRPNTPTPV